MKGKKKWWVWLLVFLAFVLVFLLILMIPSVSESVGKAMKKTTDSVKSFAQTAAGMVVAVILIVVGIAALEVPVLGVPLIVGGLGMLGYNVWPLFSDSMDTTVKTDG